MTEYSYNLVNAPWISCTDLEGNKINLGFKDVFLRAHELRSIQHQNPLTEAALLRVLLAIVHRSINGPRNGQEWKRLYQAGKFDDRISQYLEKWHNRFNLFSRDTPFYQTPGLMVVNGSNASVQVPQPITSIMLGVSSGNRKTLFNHTVDKMTVKISPSEAANVLTTAQMFSLGGLNKKTTNIFGYQFRFENSPMVEGIFVILAGFNLFQTLMLNLLIYADNEPIPNTAKDCPIWERNDIGKAVTDRKKAMPPKGYLDFLTCKSRHIRLVPEEDNNGVYVEKIHIAQGEIFPTTMANPAFMRKKSKKGTWYHPQLDIDRLVWRDSVALFTLDENIASRPKSFIQVQAMHSLIGLPMRYICAIYAIANKDANPLARRREKLNIPLSLLSDRRVVAYLEKGIGISEKGAMALGAAAYLFMSVYLPENTRPKEIRAQVNATGVQEMFWDGMDAHFNQFLIDLDEPENALEIWKAAIRQTARESLNICVNERYRNSTRTFKAWAVASSQLNTRLANLSV